MKTLVQTATLHSDTFNKMPSLLKYDILQTFFEDYKDLVTFSQPDILESNRWSTMSVNR
jgi:hypothetical protein